MSEKKYVHSGAFLLCDKCVAPIPVPLTVTSQLTVSLPGGLWATSFDELPVLNVPPFGVCAITHVPCTYAPLPPGWNPVMESVEVGPLGGKALLEDSKIRCIVGGQISIYLTKAAALATLPDVVSQKFDSAYAYLESVGPPFGGMLRDQLGEAKGVWQGALSMGQGLWALAKMKAAFDQKVDNALLFAVQHPVAAAHAVAEGTQKAATAGWQAVTDKDNWLAAASVAENAMPGVLVAKGAVWLSDEQNRAKVGAAYDKAKAWEAGLTDYERSTIKGRIGFEVVALLVPETKLAKAAEVAKLAEGSEAAAGGMRMLGEVRTGAKGAAEAAEAPGKLEELFAGIKECLTEGHPVDVATGLLFTQATDFTLPGPLPLVWTRTWFSTSSHLGVLGHGWHHDYDMGLMPAADGGATLRLADGRQAVFAPPVPGTRSFHRRHKLELAHDAAGFRVWNLRERVWYVFEPAGPAAEQRLQAVEDANGCRIQFAYTPAGHLATLTDSAGRVLPCETDAAGRLLALHAPDPDQTGATFALVRYAYDEAGDLVTATDALGHTARFAYAGHLLTRETFRSGLNFYFEYDGTGPTARCVHTWGDGGIFDTRLQYNTPNHTTVWDSYGHQKEYYHQRGLVIQRRDALGAVQKWRYNPAAELEHYIDPLGNTTRYDYDGRGNQVTAVHPNSATVTTQFNAQDLPVQGTDANGGTWQWQYDEQGRLLCGTDSTQASTRYTYDSFGRLTTIDDGSTPPTRLRYDAQHNLTQIVEVDGKTRLRTYDCLGRMLETTGTSGNTQRRRYDLLGQLVAVQTSDREIKRLSYNADGKVTYTKDELLEVDYRYNLLGQIISRREGGREVTFKYDLEGRLVNLHNENREDYLFSFDAAGHVTEEVGFDGLTRRYIRDAAGRIVQTTRPAGCTTRYVYDSIGCVTEVIHNQVEQSKFRYRADGMLVEATNQAATVHLERDPLGRIVREVQNGISIESTYNALGWRTSLNSSLGVNLTLGRDLYGAVTHMQAGEWFGRIERDTDGLELSRTLSGGVQTHWLRDSVGRPTSQRITVGGAGRLGGAFAVRQRSYSWQGENQLLAINDSLTGEIHYGYDMPGHLSNAVYPDGTEDIRLSDAVGNLFRTADYSDRRYGKGGQLREANGTRYKYDDEGNLIRKTTSEGKVWRYAWDGAGQLACVTRPDGYAVTFAYDALGRRVSKRFRGRATKWVWDGHKPLHEWTELEVGPNSDNAENLATWLFDEDSFSPTAKLTKKGAFSVVTDHLGTPLELYDNKGTKSWEAQLDSYGQVISGRGKPQDCPFRYQGQYEDTETGLYYNRFRYYDPETGCYISQDPIRLAGSKNMYSYVSNTAASFDALGLDEKINVGESGHHVPAVRKSVGRPFEVARSNKTRPTLHFRGNDPANDHWRLHEAERNHVGARQGSFSGTNDELFDAYRKAYEPLNDIRVDVRSPNGTHLLAEDVTAREAVDIMHNWLKTQGICPPV